MPLPRDIDSVSAVLCEKALRDQDDLLSAIRICDTIRVSQSYPAVQFFVLVLAQSSSEIAFERQMTVRVREPMNNTTEVGSDTAKFDRKDYRLPVAARMVLEFWYKFNDSGPHWIDVYLDGDLLVSVSLMVHVVAA